MLLKNLLRLDKFLLKTISEANKHEDGLFAERANVFPDVFAKEHIL